MTPNRREFFAATATGSLAIASASLAHDPDAQRVRRGRPLSSQTDKFYSPTATIESPLNAPASTPIGTSDFETCAFIKFIQELSYDELAEAMAKQGFQGVEATIRPGGIIEPKDAAAELPKLVAALAKQNLRISVMATAINNPADKLSQTVLRVAADLGIKTYRTDYYRYNLKQPIAEQAEKFKPTADALAAFNEQLGITGVYQNHAGPQYLGSLGWDLHTLLKDINPDALGIAFDIRHAVASAGTSWPIHWDLCKSHVRAIYMKDFVWEGAKHKNVPLKEGIVPKDFFKRIGNEYLQYPISLHIEYVEQAGTQVNLTALENDLATLKKWLSQ